MNILSALQHDNTDRVPAVWSFGNAQYLSMDGIADWAKNHGPSADITDWIVLDIEDDGKAMKSDNHGTWQPALQRRIGLHRALRACYPQAKLTQYALPFTLSAPMRAYSAGSREMFVRQARRLRPLMEEPGYAGPCVACYDWEPGLAGDSRYNDTVRLAKTIKPGNDEPVLTFVRHRYVEAGIEEKDYDYRLIPALERQEALKRLKLAGATDVALWGGDWSDFFHQWTNKPRGVRNERTRAVMLKEMRDYNDDPKYVIETPPSKQNADDWEVMLQELYADIIADAQEAAG